MTEGEFHLTLRDLERDLDRTGQTILRWIKEGRVSVVLKKNSRGHYVFSPADLSALRSYKSSVTPVDPSNTTTTPPIDQ